MKAVLTGLVLLLVTVSTGHAADPPLTLSGSLVQGGLVIGHTRAGTRVWLGEQALRVSPDGVFLFGLGRDAKSALSLRLVSPEGDESSHPVTVEARTFPVQHIDGLPPKSVTPPPEVLQRIADDNARIGAARRQDDPRQDFLAGFQWPVSGTVTGVFGSQRVLNGKPRSPHKGVDIAAASGTPVLTTAPGVVSLVDRDMFYTGMTVMVSHGHGLHSIYAHMADITVSEGQRVAQGEQIGSVGQSGRATGPHLHWGVSWFSKAVDPQMLAGPLNP